MSSLLKRLRRTRHFRQEEIKASTTIEDPLPQPAVELRVPNAPEHGLRIANIPDVQAREGVELDHLDHAGKYIAAKQPDIINCIGDWWDLPSLSDWNKPGSLEKENRRYEADVAVGCDAMERFLNPIAKVAGYKPLMVFELGNHEDRVVRAYRADPSRFTGRLRDLRLEQYGWKVIPYLQPVVIGGVAFCHFFPTGVMGRPVQSARALLSKMHMSCVAGHQQGRDIAYSRNAAGKTLTGLISGSFYQHNEPYMSPLANRHWRGMWMFHEVKDGQFDEMAVSISFLKRKFGP